MPDCVGVFGRIFGHKYEARESVKSSRRPPEIFGQWMSLDGESAKAFATQRDTEKRTYHGDVCARCGNILMLRRVPTAQETVRFRPDPVEFAAGQSEDIATALRASAAQARSRRSGPAHG